MKMTVERSMRGMPLRAKISVVLFLTFVVSVFICAGWYQPNELTAATLPITTSQTWTAPAGVTSVTVECWGGGGAGGGATGTASYAGGGAGGQYARKVVTVTPGNNYAVVIGAGGIAGTTTVVPGGDTTFAATTVVAKGGAGGATASGTTSIGGAGSTTGGVGDLVYAGGSGGSGTAATVSGGGGGGGGSTGTGSSAAAGTAGGATAANGGAGGAGVAVSNTRNNGTSYGGGGSGGYAGTATDRTGGNGGVGYVILTYNLAPVISVATTDTPDPVTQGNTVTFAATATDSDSDNWYLAVCKTGAITPGTAGAAPACPGGAYGISSAAVASGSQNTATWTATGSGAQSWYAFACDNAAFNTQCSAVNTTNSPLTVKLNQTITFNALPTKNVGAADFDPGATTSSALTITYVSSNTAVATIVGGLVHIVGAGTTDITARQAGDSSYNAAADVTQSLSVSASSVAILTVTFNGAGSGTIASNPSGFINCPGDCSETFASGLPVSLSLMATPDWKSLFSGWSGACTGSGNCDLVLSSDAGVMATFDVNGQATILGHSIAEYGSLQDAYNVVVVDSIIAAHVYTFKENLTLNRPFTVNLDFGKGDLYLNPVGYTTLQGTLTCEQGTAIISNLIIQ